VRESKLAATVECVLCPTRCVLENYQRGDCRVRINVEGRLKTLVYGKPCAVHVDPVEKKPLFHFMPGTPIYSIATAGCNLHCKYCQNWGISQTAPEDTRNVDLDPKKTVAEALAAGCKSIAYTYAEPIVFFEYTVDTCRLARKEGLRNVLVTAGYVEEEPLLELCDVSDAANVDLKAITDDFYRDVCGGRLEPVQRTLKTMQEAGVWLEVTNLVVPTLNDSPEMVNGLIMWILENLGPDVPLHFSKFTPMFKLANLPPTSVETLTSARDAALSAGIHFPYVGNVPGHEGNNTYCPYCGHLLVGRFGYLITDYDIIDGKCGECGKRIPGVWEHGSWNGSIKIIM
jgi:pyruvate formate lyase activating enzyme